MVGGKIVDMFSMGEDLYKILVKENRNTCCVMACIPSPAVKEVNIGDVIWWQSGKVYFNVFDCPDTPFEKHLYSGGNARSFYEDKLKRLAFKSPNNIK